MENPQKQCRTCGETKPMDTEHFYSREDRPTYFSPDCKDCHKAKQNQKYANNPEFREKIKALRRTPESRERQYILQRERRANDPEWRKKDNARQRERYRNDTKKREQRNASRRERYRNDPEFKENLLSQQREKRANDPERRERENARQRDRYHNDPEYRENRLAKEKTPESRERKNLRSKERWVTDQEYKARKLTRQKVRYDNNRDEILARQRTPEKRERMNLWKRKHWKENRESSERQLAKQKYKYHNNRDYRRRVENRELVKRYGITTAERERKKLDQESLCAICGQHKKLNVDHNHQTGRVRGLLCIGCNGGLGFFSEDIRILVNAIEYLKRPRIAPQDVQPLPSERPFARFEIPHWEAQSRDKEFRKIKNQNLKRSYNIDIDQYEALLEKGNGVCWICFRPETRKRRKKAPYPEALYVDHHHSSGMIRGLLCRTCNTGIGYFDDDPERVAKAIEYLVKWDDADPLAA